MGTRTRVSPPTGATADDIAVLETLRGWATRVGAVMQMFNEAQGAIEEARMRQVAAAQQGDKRQVLALDADAQRYTRQFQAASALLVQLTGRRTSWDAIETSLDVTSRLEAAMDALHDYRTALADAEASPGTVTEADAARVALQARLASLHRQAVEIVRNGGAIDVPTPVVEVAK